MAAKIFPDLKGSDRVREDCRRCGGDGVVHWGNVVLDGYVRGRRAQDRICFECNGAGDTSVLVSSVRARVARQVKAEAEREAKAAKFAAEAEVREAAKAERERVKAEAEAARRAAAEPVPVTDDRIKITGEVLGFKEVEDNYSYFPRTIVKVLIRDDRGFTVYGTSPGLIDRGDRISFMARVERSDRDELFGFYKRATQVQVITEAAAA